MLSQKTMIKNKINEKSSQANSPIKTIFSIEHIEQYNIMLSDMTLTNTGGNRCQEN